MKTRWELHFQAWGVHLGRSRRFVCRSKAQHPGIQMQGPSEYEVLVLLDAKPLDGADESGRLLVTAQGQPEETEPAVCFVPEEIRERLCFPEGRMKLLGGFLHAERIPETPEEEAAVAENRHFVRLTIEESSLEPRFDIGQFPALKLSTEHGALLRQFNAAKALEAPPERFIAMFKVLEKAYAGRRGDLLGALQGSEALYLLAAEIVGPVGPGAGDLTREAFNRILATLVRIRDNCAHLRGKTGYSPGDPRIRGEVEPYLGLVENLARRCIERHAGWTAAGGAGQGM